MKNNFSAYLDIQFGISGDMFVAAFIDLGLEIGFLNKEIKKLGIKDLKVEVKTIKRGHINAKLFKVLEPNLKKHLTIRQALKIIEKSKLSKDIKKNSLRVLNTLFAAEKHCHKIKKGSFVIIVGDGCLGYATDYSNDVWNTTDAKHFAEKYKPFWVHYYDKHDSCGCVPKDIATESGWGSQYGIRGIESLLNLEKHE